MQSRLVTRKNELERELRRGVRDPARKRYLTARLVQIENDIRSMGFSDEEIEKNEFPDGVSASFSVRIRMLPDGTRCRSKSPEANYKEAALRSPGRRGFHTCASVESKQEVSARNEAAPHRHSVEKSSRREDHRGNWSR
jgi:hypothetical protein